MEIEASREGDSLVLTNPPRRWRHALRALVLADRGGETLAPLDERSPVAMLPIASRPLIFHVLQDLADAGVSQVVVAASKGSEEIREALGDGSRWGLAIEHVLTRGNAPLEKVLRKLPGRESHWLVVRGDQFLSPCIGTFLGRITATPHTATLAVDEEGRPLPIAWVRSGDPMEGLLPSPDHSSKPGTPQGIALARLEGVRVDPLDTFLGYHQVNLDVAQGKVRGLEPPGHLVAMGLRAGRRSHYSLRTIRGGASLIGSHCTIQGSAELLGNVVLSDDTFIDRKATLENSIILPHTYVGELLEVRNAIVAGDLLIRVDTGAVTRITDDLLIGDLGRDPLTAFLSDTAQRAIGWLVLVASLPLWPLAVIASWNSGRGILEPIHLLSNSFRVRGSRRRDRVPFKAHLFRCKAPVLRHLPWLWAVASGHLRMVGVTPIPADEPCGEEEWQELRHNAHAGLLGLAQLTAHEEATAVERHLMDVVHARTKSRASQCLWMLRGLASLFTPRAWIARGSRTRRRRDPSSEERRKDLPPL